MSKLGVIINTIGDICLAFVVVMLVHSCAKADTTDVEYTQGSLTYHILDNGAAKRYEHKLSEDGRLINNPIYGISVTSLEGTEYTGLSVFGGDNSIGEYMQGAIIQQGVEINRLQVGLAYGGYMQEAKKFSDRGLNSFRLTNIEGIDLVPILGLAINYKIMLTNDSYLKFNNLIEPLLINTTLSVGLTF